MTPVRRGQPGTRARLIGLAAWRGVGELYDSDAMTHAASIAYYALLSLFPFTLLALSILGSATANPAERDSVVRFILQYFPRQFEFITGQLAAFETTPVSVGIGGTIALTWASLGVFNAVTSAVNHAWGVEERRSFLRHRLVSFLMLVAVGAVLLAGLTLTSVVRAVEAGMSNAEGMGPPWLGWLTGVTARSAATALIVGGVALVFYYIPNVKVRLRDVWPGAVMVALLWRAALSLFSWYASDLARLNVVHGSIAAVVVFLIWIYVSAVILLFGAEMTASYVRLQEAERQAG